MSEPPLDAASSSLDHIEKDEDPPKKKLKLESSSSSADNSVTLKLEDRLGSILCCTVCLDVTDHFIYQCVHGHLMCHRCLEHLLADARLKDETSTCPNCRVEISKNQVNRNLAVEKAIAELPATCKFCRNKFQRCVVQKHERTSCDERIVGCQYQILGCSWKGPFIEQADHEKKCTQPSCEGRQILPYLRRKYVGHEGELFAYHEVMSFLTLEKMCFNDIQLKPFRTDEFLHRLMYDASSFAAFGHNWSIKVCVNDHDKDAHLSTERHLAYQLILKTKPSSPMHIRFFMVIGYSRHPTVAIGPSIYESEFNEKHMESSFLRLTLAGNAACNQLLAMRAIDVRIYMALCIR